MKADTFAGVYQSTGWRHLVILFCTCLECGAFSRSGAYEIRIIGNDSLGAGAQREWGHTPQPSA